jgi:hypothetical protein
MVLFAGFEEEGEEHSVASTIWLGETNRSIQARATAAAATGRERLGRPSSRSPHSYYSAQAASLTLPLQQGQGVPLTDGALDVADDGTLGVVDELDANLGHVTGGASLSQNPAQSANVSRSVQAISQAGSREASQQLT